MKALIFDTETTGFIHTTKPALHPAQPHMVQLGAALLDMDTGEVGETINKIVRPTDWHIPANLAAIHGITTERAREEGATGFGIIAQFFDLTLKTDVLVGHTVVFDKNMLGGRVC